MKALDLSIAAAMSLLIASAGYGQVVSNNFFDQQGVALYNPVVDVVNSGARLVAQPTVSADLKYVTITAQPQVAQLVALQTFPVATGTIGLVGGPVQAPAPRVNNANAAPTVNNANAAPPVVIRAAGPGEALKLTGMVRIDGL